MYLTGIDFNTRKNVFMTYNTENIFMKNTVTEVRVNGHSLVILSMSSILFLVSIINGLTLLQLVIEKFVFDPKWLLILCHRRLTLRKCSLY